MRELGLRIAGADAEALATELQAIVESIREGNLQGCGIISGGWDITDLEQS